jgi:peptidoglycan/LPS O-acetylase OafA/YrhL
MHPGLDTFRLLAFLTVFLFHAHLLPVGYVGVLAFFVLSGFLITPILVDMREELDVRRYFLSFYGRRTLRIFPLYYFYLGVLGAVAAMGFATQRMPAAIGQVADQILYALTYSYDFFHASRAFSFSPLLTHFWSLAVEEQFYLVWPLVVFCVGSRRLKPVLLALVIAGPLLRLAEGAIVTSHTPGLFGGPFDTLIYVLPFSHLDAFALGGYLALYGRTPSPALLASYAVVLAAVGLVTERFTGGGAGLTLGYGPFMAGAGKYVWGYTAVNLLFGGLLLVIRDRRFMPRLVEQPALVYLGKISYGLYVYHFAVLWLFSHLPVLMPDRPALSYWSTVAGALCATVAVSAVSYAVVERPFLRLKDRYFAKRRRPATEASPLADVAGARSPVLDV